MDHKKETIITYQGLLSADVIDNLINEFRHQTEGTCIKKPVFKKVLTVIIESLENVYKYYQKCSDEHIKLNTNQSPTFKLEKDDHAYIISTSNIVFKDEIPGIVKRIDIVNNKNNEDLKELYLKTIRNGHFSKQGGAGLGLIKIARASHDKLGYDFKDVNDNMAFYTLQTKITEN